MSSGSITIGAHPSYIKSAWNNLLAVLPKPLISITDVPTKSRKWTRATRDIQRGVAGKLLDEKWSVADPENEAGNKDVMSLLGELS